MNQLRKLTLNPYVQAAWQFARLRQKMIANILKVVVSIGLLIFIFKTIDLPKFWQVIQKANFWWLAAAVGVAMLGVVIRAVRWQILLKALGIVVSTIELTALYFIGFLFSSVLPSGVGGDAIRILELNRYSERGADAVTSVLVERFLGISAAQALGIVALLVYWGVVPTEIALLTIAIFLGSLTIGYLLINRRLYLNLRQRLSLFRRLTDISLIGKLFESFQRYPLPALGRSYLVSILFNMTLIVMYTFIGWAVNAPVGLAQFAIIVPITSLLLLLPISFAGLGVREWSFQVFYKPIGVSNETAVAMALLVLFIGTVSPGLVGGLIYLWRGARGMASMNNEPTHRASVNNEQ
jgi:glycosyltransferase 2 family protein